MTATDYQTAVKNAHSVHEAMIRLAHGIDLILEKLANQPPSDPWGEWAPGYGPPEDGVLPEGERMPAATIVEENDDGTAALIELAPVSEQKKESRRQFERQFLTLADHIPGNEDWTEAYAKGGPLWLYPVRRDLLITYPRGTLQAMIEDVMEDDPTAAEEMARDLLKFGLDEGHSVAMGTDQHKKSKIWTN